MNYVIIGNSIASIGVIEGIRSKDKSGKITVLSLEKHKAYSRPLISYLLEGKTDLEKMKYRKDSFYEDNNVQLVFEKAEKIDDKKMTVTTATKTYKADKIAVATGSNPFVPPCEGLDKVKNKFSFMTLDDACALQKVVNKNSRVLIVGAGLIGLKCAEGIFDLVKEITVVDLADRILSSILDSDGSAVLQKHLEEKGIKFILGKSVSSYTENTAFIDNKNYEFDILVTAVGVRANTSLVKDIGGAVNRGIVVDDKMQTSINDIYAAGDCCELYDITINGSRPLALLPYAYMGGYTAGVNMAGGEDKLENLFPMNSMGMLGKKLVSAGSYIGEEIVVNENGTYKKFFVKDGLLNGYYIIGDIRGAGIYTALIREKTKLSEVDFELMTKMPTLAAFSQNVRIEKIGGQQK